MNTIKTIYYFFKYRGLSKESMADLIEGAFKDTETKQILEYLTHSFDYSKDKTNLIIFANNIIKHYETLRLSPEALKKHSDRVQTVINKLNSL